MLEIALYIEFDFIYFNLNESDLIECGFHDRI